jgi:hypothetical protein
MRGVLYNVDWSGVRCICSYGARISYVYRMYSIVYIFYRVLLVNGGGVAQRQRRPSNLPPGREFGSRLFDYGQP